MAEETDRCEVCNVTTKGDGHDPREWKRSWKYCCEYAIGLVLCPPCAAAMNNAKSKAIAREWYSLMRGYRLESQGLRRVAIVAKRKLALISNAANSIRATVDAVIDTRSPIDEMTDDNKGTDDEN